MVTNGPRCRPAEVVRGRQGCPGRGGNWPVRASPLAKARACWEVAPVHRMLLSLPRQIETERLLLKPYQAGDGPTYYQLCVRNREHLLPFEAGNPALGVTTPDDAEVLVREFAADWAARSMFFFGIWLHDGGGLIGQVVLSPVTWDLPEFAVGYFVDAGAEGRGYISEAVQAVLAFAFDCLGAARVRLNCNETNLRSVNVARRCGFTCEGLLRETKPQHRLPDGRASGDYIFGMLREEYEAGRRRGARAT